MEYEEYPYVEVLRTWAAVTENLLAFDPFKVDEWYAQAKACADDDSLWPAEYRELAREKAYDGTLAETWFRPEFHQYIQDQQRTILGAREDLDVGTERYGGDSGDGDDEA